MPVDSSGNITRPSSPIPVTGQTADAPQVNVAVDDMINSMNMLMFLDGRKPLRGNIPMNGYRARGAADAEQPQDYVTLAQLQALVASGTPTGAGMWHTGTTAPPGWLIADGSTLSRATFPNLWAFVQTSGNLAASEASKDWGQYGPGNGSTTFTLPNMTMGNGLFVRSTSPGRSMGTAQAGAIQSHVHTGTTSAAGDHQHGYIMRTTITGGAFGSSITGVWAGGDSPSGVTGVSGSHAHTFTTNATGDTETRPINVAYPFIIKA